MFFSDNDIMLYEALKTSEKMIFTDIKSNKNNKK